MADDNSPLVSRLIARKERAEEQRDRLAGVIEQIRALADEYAAFQVHDTLHAVARDLRRVLPPPPTDGSTDNAEESR